jgi:hypothetical protein
MVALFLRVKMASGGRPDVSTAAHCGVASPPRVVDALESDQPTVRVIRIANASQYTFISKWNPSAG